LWRYRFWGILLYLILLLSALASLLKRLCFGDATVSGLVSAAGLLRSRPRVDATAFIFEYLLGVYDPGVSHYRLRGLDKGRELREGELFRFVMRRFSYVLNGLGLSFAVSMLIVRLPLLLAYFTTFPVSLIICQLRGC